ncbi:hypothetical protein OF001_U30249 [Pseudomonas sp. OF001]|nr:hypothetical protein OF001_U30249 [Pseudomonas sp. OF001]
MPAPRGRATGAAVEAYGREQSRRMAAMLATEIDHVVVLPEESFLPGSPGATAALWSIRVASLR